jgi:hypothetical protein
MVQHVEDAHESVLSYDCGDCAMSFPKLWMLGEHRRFRHETDRSGLNLFCADCEKYFSTRGGLAMHTYWYHTRREATPAIPVPVQAARPMLRTCNCSTQH